MFFSMDYSCDRQSHSILVFKLFDDTAEQGKRDSLPYFATCVWWICPYYDDFGLYVCKVWLCLMRDVFFYEIPVKNMVSYSAMITCYTKNGGVLSRHWSSSGSWCLRLKIYVLIMWQWLVDFKLVLHLQRWSKRGWCMDIFLERDLTVSCQ